MSTIRLFDLRVTFEKTWQLDKAVGSVVGGFFGGAERFNGAAGMRRVPALEPARLKALDGVNLEIRDGETMGVLGPSGCGKSTLLRAIAGLTPLDSGQITYDDRDMVDVSPGERGIGIVFQSYALYPTMTSFDNVGFFLRVRKRDSEIPERVREVSRVMGIGFDKLLGRRPQRLSGGERQRVAVARCIARDPKLFLFDEPLSNLDAKLRVQTRSELKRLINRFKVTGVYVTHDQTEALALSDRIAIMNEGRIEQVGTAQFIFDHPVSVFVATFFGHPPMNTFEGVVSENQWHGDNFSIDLPDQAWGSAQQLTLGIRAEHIHLAPEGPLVGKVVLLEPMPVHHAQLAYIELPKGNVVAQIPQEAGVHVGHTVNLAVDTTDYHLFDTRTGRRL
jgi:multiple sugar transport system ATP-binding protein